MPGACIAMQQTEGVRTHGSPGETRRWSSGRFAAENRAMGKGKPETFNFLGFTHISGKDRNGRFMLITKDPPDG